MQEPAVLLPAQASKAPACAYGNTSGKNEMRSPGL
jgi:hypothetical protein